MRGTRGTSERALPLALNGLHFYKQRKSGEGGEILALNGLHFYNQRKSGEGGETHFLPHS